jgi:protein-S-isoprenylcysteine O-methyltransferase Ste14
MRLIPPIWLLFSLIAIYAIDRFLPAITPYERPWTQLGYAIMAFGFLVVLYCATQFRKNKTTIHPGHTPSILLTTGIYRLSRNPIYLAMAIILLGATLSTANLVTLPIPLIFVGIITELFIKPEERILAQEFGEPYAQYQHQTRRWI